MMDYVSPPWVLFGAVIGGVFLVLAILAVVWFFTFRAVHSTGARIAISAVCGVAGLLTLLCSLGGLALVTLTYIGPKYGPPPTFIVSPIPAYGAPGPTVAPIAPEYGPPLGPTPIPVKYGPPPTELPIQVMYGPPDTLGE
jgi:hypothetical protein